MSLLWSDPFLADPWTEMRKMQRDMDRLFSTQSTNLLEGPSTTGVVPQGANMRELANWRPVVDVKSTDNNIIVHAELPGVRKEDINIELKVRSLSSFIVNRKRMDSCAFQERDVKRRRKRTKSTTELRDSLETSAALSLYQKM